MVWRRSEHERVTARAWDQRLARDAIEAIVADADAAHIQGFWPVHPLDDVPGHDRFSSLYIGSAGMIWGLWRLGSWFDASAAVGAALDHYRAAPDFGSEAHAPSLWMGETGLLVVAQKVGSPAADRERLRDLIRRNREHPTWELMWGSPGTMLAARACDLPEEWEESATALWASWDDASDLWTQDMYGQVKQYLGPAHAVPRNRARRFAMHAMQQVDQQRAEVGRGRYTLWTGDIGVALYVQACLDARAEFPTIDAF